jgi:predicted dehydrogenase
MPEKIRAAVVGAGHLGQHHARIYTQLENCSIDYVADTDTGNANKKVSKLGLEVLDDYRLLLGKIDAVSIATPTVTHHEISRFFLENGVHVLVEKPITKSPEEASDLIEIAKKNNLILQVGHVERFNAAVQKVREYIDNPKFIEVNRLGKFPERSLDIGVVLDLMIHDIDIILSFVRSSVKKMDVIGSAVLTDKEDIANARLVFENGAVANITASRVSYKNERKFRVFQPDSYISLDYTKQDFVIYKKKKEKISSPKDLIRLTPKVEKSEPLKCELESFLKSIENRDEPEVSGSAGLQALELALEITEKI